MIEISADSSMQDRLERATEHELRLAAEAVVDAAIWRHKLRADTVGAFRNVPEETRLAMIELLVKDPGLTPFLFRAEAWERH